MRSVQILRHSAVEEAPTRPAEAGAERTERHLAIRNEAKETAATQQKAKQKPTRSERYPTNQQATVFMRHQGRTFV